ncbi:MAG: DNA-processing protein DprA [Granulosicoccaceae bacterium]
MNSTLAALSLLHTPGIGARTVHNLIASFGDASSALHASDKALQQAGLQSKQITALRAVDKEHYQADLAWAELDKNHLIAIDHPLYPPRLKEIDDPPPLLFVTGDPEVLSTPQVAMVGSRNPTAGGLENAQRFAAELAMRGLCITSGLATGIDAASHRGALSVDGLSIAVTGTGLDRVYPASNRELAHQLAEHGALVSELPIGSAPKPANFPRRNRIISALSSGVLVVEATVRSGSLITARQATEQGREVLAIPGSIHNPMARGCHALIRQGAKLVETTDDVLEELADLLDSANFLGSQISPKINEQAPLTENEDPEYEQLLIALGHDPVGMDTLVERTGLPVAELSSMLLMLELTGKVDKASGGRYTRKS